LHIALARVYYNRGVTYSYLTRPAEALADYTRAIELNSIYAKAYYNRGVAYTELGRSVEALTDFKRTIEIDPADALAHVNIGALFASQDKLHEALPYFEQAAQLGSPEGVEYAALARQQLGIEAVPSPQHGTEGIFPAQQAFYAMMQASSLDELRQVVAQFPFMADPTFMQMVEQFIAEQVPPEERPYYEQRLTALQQIAEEPSTKEVSPGQQASYALGQAGSLDELRQVVAQFPFMTEPTFIQAVNQAIAQRVSPEQRQPFEQRLSWLRQIADEQQ
jgi:tetratricopeptide (TPR) repeat protein